MTTPTGTIGLDDVQTEFGGTNPIELTEYYAGGSYVPATVSGVPTSGTIGLDDLRGKTKIIYAISLSISPSTGTYPFTSTLTWTSNLPVGGYVNLNITYPNGTTSQLTNQPINGTAQVTWGSTIGTGAGSVYATGYSSTNALLATSNTVNVTVSAPATYAFSSQTTNVNEGSSASFSISTTNVVNGTTLYWTVANATTSDADFNAASGSFTISGNTGSFTVLPIADITTEGSETFRVTVRINSIYGTIVLTSDLITIADTSTATYSLTSNSYNVNEGGSFTITFATNQPNSFLYTISGVSSADIGNAALTGSISNGNQITYNVTADSTTEGTETFVFSLNNGQASTSITINDTSQTPATYSLTSNKSSVNEGDNFTITFVTNQSGSFPYTISGVGTEDIGSASMSGSLSNGNQITYTATADNTTDSANPETFNIALNNGLASVSVNIYDTSQTPYYTLTRSTSSVNEGTGFYIDFSTNQPGTHPYTISGVSSADIGGASLTGNISNGDRLSYTATADNTTEGNEVFNITCRSATTSVLIYDTSQTPYYTLTRSTPGVNEGDPFYIDFSTNQSGSFAYTISGVSSADIGGASLTGSVSNGNRLNYTSTADNSTEGTEYFQISLDNGQASTSVTINDSSKDPPYYTFTRSTSAVNEGSSFYVDFTTNQSGSFNYTISGVSTADIGVSQLTGSVTNGNRLNFTAAADNSTEGTETFTIALNNGQASTSVTIYDTSQTPTYSWTRSASSVSEGGSFYFDFATNQPGSFGYTISGLSSADIGGASLTGTVSNGSRLSYNVTADNTTEGLEAFNISLDNGQANGTLLILDTSLTPATYSFSTNKSSVNEGDNFTVTFATNQSGSFSYSISGVSSADINSAALSGSVSNGSQITFYTTADSSTEGTETFTISSMGASTSVTIYDTSITPIIPSFTSFGITRPNAYPSADVTISWTTSNASYVTIYVYDPGGNTVVAGTVGANSSYIYYGSASRTLGTYTVTLTAYSSTGNTTSQTQYYTVIQQPIYPSFGSYSASPTSAYNTDNISISWTTSNASYVNISINNPGGSNIVNQTVGTNTSYTYYGNSANSIGQYTVTLTAYSSTGNTTSATVYFTLNAPPTFAATFTGFTSFPSQTAGPNVYWNGSNNIVIYGTGNQNIDYYGIAYYTTNIAGYIYLFLDKSTESGWDFAYLYLDGVLQNQSSGSGYSLNNTKVAVPAGSHSIQVRYTKDGSVNGVYDYVSGAWTWSAT